VQNFLGRCLALTLVGGGFTVTGDLGWLARHGARVLSATGVPETAAEDAVDEAAPIPALPGADAARVSAFTRPAVPRGPDRVAVGELRRGDRLLVWLEGSACAAGPLVLDVIDPVSGAAILHRGGGERVRIDGHIRRGGTLRLVPLGLAHAAPAPETLGPVVALAVESGGAG